MFPGIRYAGRFAGEVTRLVISKQDHRGQVGLALFSRTVG